MFFAVLSLEMCSFFCLFLFPLDVLYFHSCGIVGIMMVMIKLAHLLLFMYAECELGGLKWHSMEGPIMSVKAVLSAHLTP